MDKILVFFCMHLLYLGETLVFDKPGNHLLPRHTGYILK